MSNDYGGNRYGKKPFKSKPNNRLSFNCRDCRKLRYVSPRELSRASRPRCLGCGGPLVESDTTAEKTLNSVADNIKADNELAPNKNGSVCCKSCKIMYGRHYALALHLKESTKCLEEYNREKWFFLNNGRLIYRGTMCIRRTVKNQCKVVGLIVTSREIEAVEEFTAIYLAKEYVKDHVVSLFAAQTIDSWISPTTDKVKPDFVCPGCNAKFVDSQICEARLGLIMHLESNKDCLDEVRDVSILSDVQARAGY